MAFSRSRDRLEVMVLEAQGLLAVEGGHSSRAEAPDIPAGTQTRG